MADALETMRKAMALQEAVAAQEQTKGDKADLRIMADAMAKAADLARDIAAVEDRRGIAPKPRIEPIEVTFCERITGICPLCKGEVDGYVAPPERVSEKVVAALPDGAKDAPAPAATSANNVVPIKQGPRSIHDGAPLKPGQSGDNIGNFMGGFAKKSDPNPTR